MTAALLLGFAAFALLAWHDHRKAFFVFVAALPAYVIRFDILGLPTTALEVLFVLLFAAWLLRREKRFVDIKGWKLILLFWLAAATAAVFVSPDMRAALGHWKAYFVEPVVFFIIANDILRAEDGRKNALIALGGAAIAVGAFAVFQRLTGLGVPPPWDGTEGFRATSFYPFPNAVGLFLAPLVPLFAVMLAKEARCRRCGWFWLAAVLASLAAIILAQTEGAMIGILAGLVVMGLAFRRSRLPTVLVAALAAAVLLLSPAARPAALEKITLEDWSGRVRKEMWTETSNMLRDRPLLGAGLAGYPIAFAPYHEAGHIEIFQYPHNVILNFWSELGAAGVIVFLAIVIVFFRTTLALGRRRPEEKLWAAGLAAAMTALLVHGLVDVPYLKNELAFQFWLIIAFASSQAAEKRGQA